MCIPMHSPWLPGYIDVTQTALTILIMAGLFPDKPHILPGSQLTTKIIENTIIHVHIFFCMRQ